ncbi:MAG: acyl carrier protein [Magnetococcales bacterium]|nr:acyl carrier protein [Magnetococcales bacterium]
MDPQPIQETIQTFLEQQSGLRPAPDDDLFETGVLDSMGVVDLILHLEEVWNLEFNPEDVSMANLVTVRAITAMVRAMLPP